jgi:hypothetical protein
MTSDVSVGHADFIFKVYAIQEVLGTGIVKGKGIPLQAWTGPEGSRWLPDFKTTGT